YFGPQPRLELLAELAHDSDPTMRARVARLMGGRADDALMQPLISLLNDRDPWVRRVACESIAHRGTGAPVPTLVKLLADRDRFVAVAARRALEKMPADEWQAQVLAERSPRPFLQGATGVLVAYPSPEVSHKILTRCEAMLRGDVNEPGQKRGQISDANY